MGGGAEAKAAASRGVLLAALGVAFFSLTFPATAWALEGFGPWTATTLRVVGAGLVATVALTALRVRCRPCGTGRGWPSPPPGW